MGKKIAPGVTNMPYKPSSTLHLEGTHAKQTVSHKVGSSHKFMVTAKKVSHRADKFGHASSYEIGSISSPDNDADDADKG